MKMWYFPREHVDMLREMQPQTKITDEEQSIDTGVDEISISDSGLTSGAQEKIDDFDTA